MFILYEPYHSTLRHNTGLQYKRREEEFGNGTHGNLSTSPPDNHAVLYIRAIYRITQDFKFILHSQLHFDVLNQKTPLKVSI